MTHLDMVGEPLSAAEEMGLKQWLRERGATEAQLERGDYKGITSELVLAREDSLSAADIARRQRINPARVVEIFGAYGVAVADMDKIMFNAADERLVHGTLAGDLLESSESRSLMRVEATSLDRIAEAAVAFYVQTTVSEMAAAGLDALSCCKVTEVQTELAKRLGEGMGVLFRHHIRQAIERQQVSQERASSRDVAWQAIGFVDLVGSTALAEELDMAKLRAVVSEFEAAAFAVASGCDGRVVKFIGDEIMVSALDPTSGCRMMLELVEACSVGDLAPRGGLAWGEVLFRGGDYYGHQVNLASRLVDAAIPGEVLVDCSVPESGKVDDSAGIGFEPAGRRQLKGFADPVTVWSLSSRGSASRTN